MNDAPSIADDAPHFLLLNSYFLPSPDRVPIKATANIRTKFGNVKCFRKIIEKKFGTAQNPRFIRILYAK